MPKNKRRQSARARKHLGRREPLPLPVLRRVFPQVTEPFYLYELGLKHEPFMTNFPRGELPPIIRTGIRRDTP